MTPSAPNAAFSLARAALLALVAGLLAVVVWCGTEIRVLRTRLAALETERDLAYAAQQLTQNQLAERTLLAEGMINDLQGKLRAQFDPARMTVVQLTATDNGAATGMVAWDTKLRIGSFIGQRLPVPATGEICGLWSIEAKSQTRTLLGAIQRFADGAAVANFHLPESAGNAGEFSLSVELTDQASAATAAGRVILSGK